jgi:hypothetical protein
MRAYVRIEENQVPRGVTFHVPRFAQGQIIEVAWGTFGREEAGPGDLYQRVHDRSDGTISFYKRAGGE